MTLTNSQTVIFTKNSYISMKQTLIKAEKVASYLKKNTDNKINCFLIELEDPLSIIIVLFAIWSLGKVAALINPKMICSAKFSLIEQLGPHISIKEIQEDTDSINVAFNEEKIALLVATSGSTKDPKWIASTLKHWIFSAKGTNDYLKAKSYEPWILNLPLFHVSGLAILFRALLTSAPLVLSSDLNICSSRYSFIPKQIHKLDLENRLAPLLKAASILIGGGKVDSYTFKKLSSYPFYLTFGMTESCSSISLSTKSPKSINEGKCLLYRELIINNSQEILVKGDSVCDYQWIQGTLHSLKNKEGFYQTGDLGKIINDQLIILGRKDERIEIYGEKIYPLKIETALNDHFFFEKLIVTHIKNKDKEPIICAFCLPVPNKQEQMRLKKIVGSLFFPKYFFELTDFHQNQKILLKDLKKIAHTFISESIENVL